MATIAPGSRVVLLDGERATLRYPPPAGALLVAVHRSALGAPQNALTLTASADEDGAIQWVGALNERMMSPSGASGASPRDAIRRRLFLGGLCWGIVRPGLLTAPGVPNPYLTLYGGDRPWVVVGQLENGNVLAVPLNDARGNPKWYAPQVDARFLLFPHSKRSQLELAHLWSFPDKVPSAGMVGEAVHDELQRKIETYYS